MQFDPSRPVGKESRKSYAAKCESGFWAAYLQGPKVLDIGYRGGIPDALPICEGAVGVELGYPGYDGLFLPFDDNSQSTVYSSHVLEHVASPDITLAEWLRVVRVGGHVIIVVPHAYLYERRVTVPPSRWSGEHLRSYTCGSLMTQVERSLEPNTYRVVHLRDNDEGYRYGLPPTVHPEGCLEIELVLQKIEPPVWMVEP